MKYTLMAMLAMLTLSVSAHDICRYGISNGYKDSYIHQLRVDDLVRDGDDLRRMSYVALSKLYRLHSCNDGPNIKLRCKELFRGNSNTEVCYGENDHGYYLVTKDYLSNMNIIYNRWD